MEVVHCTEVVLNKGGFVEMGVLDREVMEMGGCTNWGCTKGVVQKGSCVNGVTRLIHSGMGLNGLLETGGKNVFKTWRLRYLSNMWPTECDTNQFIYQICVFWKTVIFL